MLSEEQKQRIQAELPRYAQKRALTSEALKIVQEARGWISNEDVRDIADFLGLTAEEVDGVATFYSMIHRRPTGRHVILLCDSVSCWILGCDGLFDHLRRTLGIGPGQTTVDGRFTLLPTACLGACDRGPAMMVDGDLHTGLTPEQVDGVLAGYP